jgi:hypothetical protein
MLVYIFLLFIVLVLLQELTRRSVFISLLFFVVLPTVLAPYWMIYADNSWFYWLKNYATLITASLMLLCRINMVSISRWVKVLTGGILIVHMLLPIVDSALHNTLLGYLNAVNGLILIALLPDVNRISMAARNKLNDFLWDVSYFWMLGYSLWGWTFVYINYPENIGRTTALILSSLVVSLYRKELWLQARVATLAIYLQAIFTSKVFVELIYTPDWYYHQVAWSAVLLSLAWSLGYGIKRLISK